MDARERALCAEGLSRRLGGRWVLQDLSLSLVPGEAIGLVGPNGAGKTTLLQLLSGVLRPHGGRVWLFGHEVSGWPLFRRARAGLGYLPQSSSVFGGLSTRHNVEAVLQLTDLEAKQVGARAARLLERFGLAAIAEQRASKLSGGERRRLELARLLAVEPRVVLLDEPFGGLDQQAASDLEHHIRELVDAGVAAIVADHRLEHVGAICGRTIALSGGIGAADLPANYPAGLGG